MLNESSFSRRRFLKTVAGASALAAVPYLYSRVGSRDAMVPWRRANGLLRAESAFNIAGCTT